MIEGSVEVIVKDYLAKELISGDPVRVEQAVLAQQANAKHGIGNWCWGNGLGLDPFQLTGGEIISL